MQLPKYSKVCERGKKYKMKLCQVPGCQVEYWGHAISKYCENHRDPRKRPRVRRSPFKYERVLTIENNFTDPVLIELECSMYGCGKTYRHLIDRKHPEVPRYCPEHRNFYKRFLTERIAA